MRVNTVSVNALPKREISRQENQQNPAFGAVKLDVSEESILQVVTKKYNTAEGKRLVAQGKVNIKNITQKVWTEVQDIYKTYKDNNNVDLHIFHAITEKKKKPIIIVQGGPGIGYRPGQTHEGFFVNSFAHIYRKGISLKDKTDVMIRKAQN